MTLSRGCLCGLIFPDCAIFFLANTLRLLKPGRPRVVEWGQLPGRPCPSVYQRKDPAACM